MTEILIDPNVRVAGNETFSGFEDVIGELPTVGTRVQVREPESNIVGDGVVTRVDDGDRLIYLAVEWSSLRPERLPTPQEFLGHLQQALGVMVPTTHAIPSKVNAQLQLTA